MLLSLYLDPSSRHHLSFDRPFGKLTVLSKVEGSFAGPFGKPFDKLTVLRKTVIPCWRSGILHHLLISVLIPKLDGGFRSDSSYGTPQSLQQMLGTMAEEKLLIWSLVFINPLQIHGIFPDHGLYWRGSSRHQGITHEYRGCPAGHLIYENSVRPKRFLPLLSLEEVFQES
jgi:hypothetical protein